MKRWLIGVLLIVATAFPVHADTDNSIALIQYSSMGTSVNLTFDVNTDVIADSLRITVDPNVVTARSRLSDQGDVVGRRYNFALGNQETVSVTLSIPELRQLGAHHASAQVVREGKVIAQSTFFVSALAGSGARRTPLTWMWPIIDRPHRGLDNVFFDDQLATDLELNGRLTRLVRAGAGHNVVWVLDPELLASIEQMSVGYQVRRGSEIVAGTGSDLASSWLDQLRLATANRDVIVLPYADPDLATVSFTDLGALRTYGLNTVGRILNRSNFTLIGDVGWSSDFKTNATIPTALAKAGFSAQLMGSDAFGENTNTYTPAALAPGIDRVNPVVADSLITAQLARGDVVGANRVLAELATITAERPADPRIQLLLPPRIWNPTDSALSTLLSATRGDEQGWMHLRNEKAGEWPAPTASAMPYSATFTNALDSMLAKIARTQVILGSDYEPSIDRAMRAFTAINANFRLSKSTLIDRLNRSASEYVNNLRILPGRYVLTGKDQSIPLTIVNGFDRTVTLSVDVQPHAPRVVIRGTTSIEIPANGRTQLQVPVTSVAAGLVAADAYLVASDGQRYGDGAVLNLDVRNIGPIGNWILYGSVALLALAVGLRLTRQMRGRRK